MDYLVITVSFLIIVSILIKVNRIEKRMKRIHFMLDQVTKRLGLLEDPIPEHPVHDELRKLIEAGEEEKAVNKAMEVLGLSYQESSHYIRVLKDEDKDRNY